MSRAKKPNKGGRKPKVEGGMPERLHFTAPEGWREALRTAAGGDYAPYVRRAILARLTADGYNVPNPDGGES